MTDRTFHDVEAWVFEGCDISLMSGRKLFGTLSDKCVNVVQALVIFLFGTKTQIHKPHEAG